MTTQQPQAGTAAGDHGRAAAASAAGAETTRREDILAAARSIFLHYGYRRASLEQIATEAGMSRTSLYHHFRNKDDIFRATAEALHEQAQASAEHAAEFPGTLAERLLAVLEARLGRLFDQIADSRHADELVGESNRIVGDLNARYAARYIDLLAGVLGQAEAAGEIRLSRAGTDARSAALVLALGAEGLASGVGAEPTAAEYRRRMADLVAIMVAAWSEAPPNQPVSKGARRPAR